VLSRATPLLLLLLAVALPASVTACTPYSPPKTETVTLSVSTLDNPYFRQLRSGARMAADAAGVRLDVVAAGNRAARQARQLTSAARQGSGAVVVAPVDSESAEAAVQPLLRRDIPVVAVDREISGTNVTSTVTSVNVEGGRLASEAVVEALEGSGQVIQLLGPEDVSVSDERASGFRDALAVYDDIEIVARERADFDRRKARRVTARLLQEHPEVDAIFAGNDQMALGAVDVLGGKAGRDVQVVGYDGIPAALRAVENGLMYATVAQLPRLLGQTAVEQAVTAIDGGDVAPSVPVGVQLVTAGNVGEYL
jgi:ABC-type sugar transport system substrate-binding protein